MRRIQTLNNLDNEMCFVLGLDLGIVMTLFILLAGGVL